MITLNVVVVHVAVGFLVATLFYGIRKESAEQTETSELSNFEDSVLVGFGVAVWPISICLLIVVSVTICFVRFGELLCRFVSEPKAIVTKEYVVVTGGSSTYRESPRREVQVNRARLFTERLRAAWRSK